MTVHSGENGVTPPGASGAPGVPGAPGPRRRVRRRDRHGRGLRGRLVPPGVPLYRTRSQQFDDMVLDAVARLEPRWEAELAGVEFAVQEVPEAEELADDSVPLPLARTVPGSADPRDPGRPATPARIVVYRRPLMARAERRRRAQRPGLRRGRRGVRRVLGLDPESVDPGYRGGFD